MYACVLTTVVPRFQMAEITKRALDMDVMEQEDALEASGSRRAERKNRKKVELRTAFWLLLLRYASSTVIFFATVLSSFQSNLIL